MDGQGRQLAGNHFVSFSKRRKGLFQKAADLCAICEAQIAVIVVSATGNPLAFGHSSVDEVLRRYHPADLRRAALRVNNPQPLNVNGFAAADERKHRKEQVEGLKTRLKESELDDDDDDDVIDEDVGIMEWIEREWETRKSVEELEFLMPKFSVLLDKVRSRLTESS